MRVRNFVACALLLCCLGVALRAEEGAGLAPVGLTPEQEALLATYREDLFFRALPVDRIDAAVEARRREYLEENARSREAAPPAPPPSGDRPDRPPRRPPEPPPPPRSETLSGWFLGLGGDREVRLLDESGAERIFPTRRPRGTPREAEVDRNLARTALGFEVGDRVTLTFYPDFGTLASSCVRAAPREVVEVVADPVAPPAEGILRVQEKNEIGRDVEGALHVPPREEGGEDTLHDRLPEVEEGDRLRLTCWTGGGRRTIVSFRWERIGEGKEQELKAGLWALKAVVQGLVDSGSAVSRDVPLEETLALAEAYARWAPASAGEVQRAVRGVRAPEGFHEQVRLLRRLLLEEAGR